jgi:YesN/AraC family two-component response regulator
MITDIFMPGMDGVETAIQLREVLPSCRVLLLSGHIKAFEYVESARQRGYDFELLRKPAHPREVVAKVKELAARPQ